MNAVLEKKCKIPCQWRWHHRALTTLHDQLTQSRQRGLHEATESQGWHDTDPAEMASEEFDRGLGLSLLSSEMDALYEVDAAISRIEDGTYGICEMTGAAIPEERLRAVPWTRYCRAAAEDAESKHSPFTEPVHPIFANSLVGSDGFRGTALNGGSS